MKKLSKGTRQYYGALLVLLLAPFITLIAQQKVKINGEDPGSWFERNWMWIVGGVVVLLIIALAGRSGNAKKRITTTVSRDDLGNVKTVTTTETKEN
jgi:hypothetical protein